MIIDILRFQYPISKAATMVVISDITFLLSAIQRHGIKNPDRYIALMLKEYHNLILPTQLDYFTDQEQQTFNQMDIHFPRLPLIQHGLPFDEVKELSREGTTLYIKG